MLLQRCKKTGNNFGIPCYEHKILIPSNKPPGMKKNLHFSLIVLFTVFTGISCYAAYQSQSLQYKAYCINNNEQQDLVVLTTIEYNNNGVNKSMHDIVICLSLQGYHFNPNNKVNERMQVKGIHDDLIACNHRHTFFNNPINSRNKKGNYFIVYRVGRYGINFVRQEFEFTKFSGTNLANSHTISVSQKTGR